MKYLTLIPDYTGSCIQDDLGNQIDLQELNLPKEFMNELVLWHSSYREIIPLSDEERKYNIDKIEELDSKGLDLAEKLRHLVPGGAKVKYYSEGKFRFLDS